MLKKDKNWNIINLIILLYKQITSLNNKKDLELSKTKLELVNFVLNDTKEERKLFDQVHKSIQSIKKNLYIIITWELLLIWWIITSNNIFIITNNDLLLIVTIIFFVLVYIVYISEVIFYLKLREKLHFIVKSNYSVISAIVGKKSILQDMWRIRLLKDKNNIKLNKYSYIQNMLFIFVFIFIVLHVIILIILFI